MHPSALMPVAMNACLHQQENRSMTPSPYLGAGHIQPSAPGAFPMDSLLQDTKVLLGAEHKRRHNSGCWIKPRSILE